MYKSSIFFIFSVILAVVFIILAIATGIKWCIIVVLICIYLLTHDIALFSCTYWPFVYFLQRKVFSDSLPIFTLVTFYY